MDKQFFYQNRAQERQREIEHELAVRSLLKEAGREPLARGEALRLVWRLAPAAGILAGLLLLAFLI